MSAPARVVEPDRAASGLRHGGRIWDESNCYLDVLTGLLLEHGHAPEPALAITLSGDWEGDQWTFCKFNDEDLRILYGIDIQELNPWNDLHDHVALQIRSGNSVLIEVDAWYLPDTRGSTYRVSHAKTTIAVVAMDPALQRLTYLHGAGKYQLDDADYRGIWHLDRDLRAGSLPPYVERIRQGQPMDPRDVPGYARQMLRRELSRIPDHNPVTAFFDSLRDGAWQPVIADPLGHFHRFAFATFRQIGANSELLAHHLRWMERHADLESGPASKLFLDLARAARAEQFKFARCVSRGRPPEYACTMADLWQDGVDAVIRLF